MLCQGGCERTEPVQLTEATLARQTARALNDPILVCTLVESCSNGYIPGVYDLRYADRGLTSQRDGPYYVNYKRGDERKLSICLFGTKSSSLLTIRLTKVGNHQKQKKWTRPLIPQGLRLKTLLKLRVGLHREPAQVCHPRSSTINR